MQYIGKIVKVHGVDGDVLIKHTLKQNFDTNILECIMVELWKDSFIPHFIDYIEATTNDEWICKFEDIQDRETAKKLSGKNVYASPLQDITSYIKPSEQDFTGYTIVHKEAPIGTIISMIHSGLQTLFEIEIHNKPVYIPVQEELIIKIHTKDKIIEMKLPEGILEI